MTLARKSADAGQSGRPGGNGAACGLLERGHRSGAPGPAGGE